ADSPIKASGMPPRYGTHPDYQATHRAKFGALSPPPAFRLGTMLLMLNQFLIALLLPVSFVSAPSVSGGFEAQTLSDPTLAPAFDMCDYFPFPWCPK
ncbi:MAG: hypothetical protein Q4G35_02300, partial [Propionibacteriaceae bacterium]|nr:hypothetical protein [Propionibacteriaceae bacterium]